MTYSRSDKCLFTARLNRLRDGKFRISVGWEFHKCAPRTWNGLNPSDLRIRGGSSSFITPLTLPLGTYLVKRPTRQSGTFIERGRERAWAGAQHARELWRCRSATWSPGFADVESRRVLPSFQYHAAGHDVRIRLEGPLLKKGMIY